MSTRTLPLALLALAACASRSPLPAPRQPLSTTPASARSAPPLMAESEAPPAVPNIQARKLDNGLVVYLLEQHGFPHVALGYVSLRGGEDPADLEAAGLASVIQQLLLVSGNDEDEAPAAAPAGGKSGGAGGAAAPGKTSKFIAYSGAVLRHVSFVSALVEAEDLDVALDVISDVVLEPELSEDNLGRARKRAHWDWDDELNGSYGIVRNHIMQRIYGPAHVLGQHADMAVKRVDAHELEAVRDGYKARYAPGASAIVIVGDVRTEEALALATRHFGAWRNDAAAPATYQPPDWEPRGKRKVFLSGGGSQAYFMVGQRAPGPASPDYAATELLTAVLGGSSASRLFTRLRSQDNLAYFASARLDVRRDGSTLMLDTAVQKDHTKEALAHVLEEMSKLQDAPVSSAELARARHQLITAELAGYETSQGALAQMIQTLELGGDPSRALEAHRAALDALDPPALQQAARRVLDPRKSPVIIMGDLRYTGDLGKWALHDDETF